MSHPHFRSQTRDHTHSLRLTFAFTGDEIRLAAVERIEMMAPGAIGSAPTQDTTGYWVAVRDADDGIVYHRALHDPIRSDIEVFGDEPGAPIYRIDNPERSGEFDVVVPDLGNAAQLSLHGPNPRARRPHGRSVELLRHDFGNLRRGRLADTDAEHGDDDGSEPS